MEFLSLGFVDHPVKLRRDEYKRLLVDIARNEPSPESLLRITIGCTDRIGETWISAQPLKTPSKDDYRDGVYILTRKMHRDNPKAKDNGFIERSTSERQLIAGRVNEVVMISELCKNFYFPVLDSCGSITNVSGRAFNSIPFLLGD